MYLACWNPGVSSICLKPLQSSETPELLCSLSIIMSLCISRWALGLSCFTGETGDVSPLHYWHTGLSQAQCPSAQKDAQCMSWVGFWSMTEEWTQGSRGPRKLSDTPSLWICFRLTVCPATGLSMVSRREHMFFLPPTSSEVAMRKSCSGLKVQGLVTAGLIGLFWFWQKQSQEKKQKNDGKKGFAMLGNEGLAGQKTEDKCLWYRVTGSMPEICLCVFIWRRLEQRGSLHVSWVWAF